MKQIPMAEYSININNREGNTRLMAALYT